MQREYVGVGTIKEVLIRANDPLLSVIFQLDCRNPIDRKTDQQVPKSEVIYADRLAFRVKHESIMKEIHV